VTLFNFTLQRGTPIVEQLVFASIRAILRGEYRPEQPFPSVRAIASDLKIHPNTAHKAVQALIEERWLEARAGVGTVVSARPRRRGGDRSNIRDDIDRLAIKARINALSLADVGEELRNRWRHFESTEND
jgi:DNA-binding transcriptional regulator YhcF (GntR family)